MSSLTNDSLQPVRPPRPRYDKLKADKISESQQTGHAVATDNGVVVNFNGSSTKIEKVPVDTTYTNQHETGFAVAQAAIGAREIKFAPPILSRKKIFTKSIPRFFSAKIPDLSDKDIDSTLTKIESDKGAITGKKTKKNFDSIINSYLDDKLNDTTKERVLNLIRLSNEKTIEKQQRSEPHKELTATREIIINRILNNMSYKNPDKVDIDKFFEAVEQFTSASNILQESLSKKSDKLIKSMIDVITNIKYFPTITKMTERFKTADSSSDNPKFNIEKEPGGNLLLRFMKALQPDNIVSKEELSKNIGKINDALAKNNKSLISKTEAFKESKKIVEENRESLTEIKQQISADIKELDDLHKEKAELIKNIGKKETKETRAQQFKQLKKMNTLIKLLIKELDKKTKETFKISDKIKHNLLLQLRAKERHKIADETSVPPYGMNIIKPSKRLRLLKPERYDYSDFARGFGDIEFCKDSINILADKLCELYGEDVASRYINDVVIPKCINKETYTFGAFMVKGYKFYEILNRQAVDTGIRNIISSLDNDKKLEDLDSLFDEKIKHIKDDHRSRYNAFIASSMRDKEPLLRKPRYSNAEVYDYEIKNPITSVQTKETTTKKSEMELKDEIKKRIDLWLDKSEKIKLEELKSKAKRFRFSPVRLLRSKEKQSQHIKKMKELDARLARPTRTKDMSSLKKSDVKVMQEILRKEHEVEMAGIDDLIYKKDAEYVAELYNQIKDRLANKDQLEKRDRERLEKVFKNLKQAIINDIQRRFIVGSYSQTGAEEKTPNIDAISYIFDLKEKLKDTDKPLLKIDKSLSAEIKYCFSEYLKSTFKLHNSNTDGIPDYRLNEIVAIYKRFDPENKEKTRLGKTMEDSRFNSIRASMEKKLRKYVTRYTDDESCRSIDSLLSLNNTLIKLESQDVSFGNEKIFKSYLNYTKKIIQDSNSYDDDKKRILHGNILLGEVNIDRTNQAYSICPGCIQPPEIDENNEDIAKNPIYRQYGSKITAAAKKAVVSK